MARCPRDLQLDTWRPRGVAMCVKPVGQKTRLDRPKYSPKGSQPAGRVLARRIQELTHDGEELAQFAIKIFRANTDDRKRRVCEDLGIDKLTDQLRLDMHAWLTIRGFGLPLQAIEVTVDDDRSLSDEELLAQLLASFDPAELRAAAERAEAARALLASQSDDNGATEVH